LRLRDGRCPFPGCGNHSLDNEADHLLAWADGGSTGIANLGQPCPKHHRLKHSSAWAPAGASKDHPPGWTSPSGRHYPSEHQDWKPPVWPDHLPTESLPDRGLPTDPHPDCGLPTESLPDYGLPVDPLPDYAVPVDPLPDYGLPVDPLREHGLPTDPRHEPDQSFTGHREQDPGLELPRDPFPDWHEFTAAHPVSAIETDDPSRPTPLAAPNAENLMLLGG
ncbi:MAG: HNH endonuclease signature motif containing protein, partial [Arthrobacter sp.]